VVARQAHILKVIGSNPIPATNFKIINMAEFEDIFGTDLYGTLFHYSFHKKAWFCFNSGEKASYFNGENTRIGKGSTTSDAFLDYMNRHQPDKIEKYRGDKL
tara:strand:+ start:277 stop:582 length:306 start_codon:yes stop_codon:yes gene_type:complete